MIKELHPGDTQISAASWNEMRAGVQGIIFPQQQYQSDKLNPVYITVKNVTGEDLPAYSILRVTTATYTDRTSTIFKNLAIKHGVEMDGDIPEAVTDTIAVTQAACADGEFVKAMVSGATPCILKKAADKPYKYAAPTASQYEYLTGTNDVTTIKVLWVASGTGNKEAYVLLDSNKEPEYFLINPGNDGTQTATNTPSIFTKGSLHYVVWNDTYKAWIPDVSNEAPATSTSITRPSGSRLVVCQLDAPDSAKEFKMPYFTPESNMGVPPSITGFTSAFGQDLRCGVKPGEHTFTDKFFDYQISANGGGYSNPNSGTFNYMPYFIASMLAVGTAGGGTVYVEYNNEQYRVLFPNSYSGLSGPDFPDVYPNDEILVYFDCVSLAAVAVDYARDYDVGTVMVCYGSAPGRGWDAYSATPQTITDTGLTLYVKVKTNAII